MMSFDVILSDNTIQLKFYFAYYVIFEVDG